MPNDVNDNYGVGKRDSFQFRNRGKVSPQRLLSRGLLRVRKDKPQSEHTESGIHLLADIAADIDWRRDVWPWLWNR